MRKKLKLNLKSISIITKDFNKGGGESGRTGCTTTLVRQL